MTNYFYVVGGFQWLQPNMLVWTFPKISYCQTKKHTKPMFCSDFRCSDVSAGHRLVEDKTLPNLNLSLPSMPRPSVCIYITHTHRTNLLRGWWGWGWWRAVSLRLHEVHVFLLVGSAGVHYADQTAGDGERSHLTAGHPPGHTHTCIYIEYKWSNTHLERGARKPNK